MQGYALSMHKIPVGVLGASGYAGRELCALIARHPALALGFATANDRRGECLKIGDQAVTLIAADDAALDSVGLVFSALPHGASADWVSRAQQAGAKVVDLSSDLRLTQPYGLPELLRSDIQGDIIANPGCYATAILLAIAPALQRVRPGTTISVAAASGVNGGGNTPRRDLLFGEVTENYAAYAVGNTHRHLPEINATVSRLGGDVDLLFTPHLLPVARGILATVTIPVAEQLDDPRKVWADYYKGEPFIEVTAAAPTLRDVVHRNVCRLSVHAAQGVRQPTLTVFAALDNLLKGAAGQAVQNANLVLGLRETLGLPT
jgi:N-acetyl-gamma-glutamyl-phosphate reductase